MSHILSISIRNYRGIKELKQIFGSEKFIVLIGRGDSGKSTILSAINAVLSPSWNMSFSDLDFFNQNIEDPIEIEVAIKELPLELLKEGKFGLYVQNDLSQSTNSDDLYIILKLTVDSSLEPHWVVKAREGADIEDKPISGVDRGHIAMNYISDYADNQFGYNKRSPLYALTKSSLEESSSIERLKLELIRHMALSIDEKELTTLNSPLTQLSQTAQLLGLKVNCLSARLDIKDNPYTGNSISLHDGLLPYRVRGKGSKRIMSIAIQSEFTKQGGIVLVDEIEQGLEPDRISLLIRKFKKIQRG